MRAYLLILILSLSQFAFADDVDEIVVTAKPVKRSAEFVRLLNRLSACEIHGEDDCREAYLDFHQRRLTEEARARLTSAEESVVRTFENKAINRLHELDLDYNSMYITGAPYGTDISVEGIAKVSSRPQLTPNSTGLYSAEESQARSALLGRRQNTATNNGSLCEIPLDAAGVTFVSQAYGTGMPDAFIDDVLALKKVDWLALESLPQTKQATIDAFLNANESSKEFKAAQRDLRKFFGINSKDEMRTSSGKREHSVMEYLKAARAKKIRVVALGPDPAYLDRGERVEPLVAATRNLVVSRAIPADGSGLVVSNWRDFHWPQNAKIQDFYAQRTSGQLNLREPTDRKCELTEAQSQACQTELTKYNAPEGCPNGNSFRCLRQKAAFLGGACKQALTPAQRPVSAPAAGAALKSSRTSGSVR